MRGIMSVIITKDVSFVIKRTSVLILTVLLLIFTVSCSESSYNEATWDGYKNKPFIDFLDIFVEKNLARQNEKDMNVSWTISYADNWKESSKLDKDDLGEDEQMRTYTVDVVLEHNGEIENNQMYFFMGYTPCEQKLTVKGIKMVEDGNEMLEIKGEEAEKQLKEMAKKL